MNKRTIFNNNEKKFKKSFSLYKFHINDKKLLDSLNKNSHYSSCGEDLKLKRHKKCSLNYKFYKILKNYRPKIIKKNTIHLPSIIDRKSFNFNSIDESNDISRKTYFKIKGNEKHEKLREIENQKRIKKIKSTKELKKKMKIIENNLKIIKINNIEKKKKLMKLTKESINNKGNNSKKENNLQRMIKKCIKKYLKDKDGHYTFNRNLDRLNIESNNLINKYNEEYKLKFYKLNNLNK